MNIEDPEGVLSGGLHAQTPSSIETPQERLERLAAGLISAGVSMRQTQRLLSQHDLDNVEQQLAWINYRAARKKASLLVTAIDQAYEAPANLPPDA